jgi:hypothetical protein
MFLFHAHGMLEWLINMQGYPRLDCIHELIPRVVVIRVKDEEMRPWPELDSKNRWLIRSRTYVAFTIT